MAYADLYQLDERLFRKEIIMNWTEGNLARHSRRKGWNAHAAKEKQHFAKASRQKASRTGIGASQGKFVPSYMSPTSFQSHRKVHCKATANGSRTFVTGRVSPAFAPLPSINESQEPRENSRCLRHGSQKHGIHVDEASHVSPAPLSLVNKKRALLAKTDWMGITLQKSLSLGEPPLLRSPEQPRMSYRQRVRNSQLRQRKSLAHSFNTPKPHHNLANGNHDIRLQIGSQLGAWSMNRNTVRSFSGSQETRSISGAEKAICRQDQNTNSALQPLSRISLNASEAGSDNTAAASLAVHPATPTGEMETDKPSYTAHDDTSQLWHAKVSIPRLQHPRPHRRVDLSSLLSRPYSVDTENIPTHTELESRCDRATHTFEGKRTCVDAEGEVTPVAGRSVWVEDRQNTPTSTVSASISMEAQASLEQTRTTETDEAVSMVPKPAMPQTPGLLYTTEIPGAAASIQDSTRAQASQERQLSSDIKFRQPRGFVGRRTSESLPQAITPVFPLGRGKRHSKRRRSTERPNIRALPSYDEDPIEE